MPTANIASFEASQTPPEPLSGLKDPASNPIFFTDPRIRPEINAFWGNPGGSDEFTSFKNEAHHPYKVDALYNNPDDLISRYDPAADDIKVFREHGEHVSQDMNKGKIRESEGEIREEELQQMRDKLERLRNDGEVGGVRSFTQHYKMQ
jgi:hypothetical protein